MPETLQPAPPTPESPVPDGQFLELNLDPQQTVSQQIKAAAGSHFGLPGLEVGDGIKRYVVIDAGIHAHTEGIAKKVGRPRLVTHGRIASLERHEKVVARETTETPMVTVEVYDPGSGDLLGVEEHPRDYFYSIVDSLGGHKHGPVKAGWRAEPEPVAHEVLPIRLTGHDSEGEPIRAFDEITAQLEARNIRSWQGMQWQHGNTIQEIVRDVALKKRSPMGDSYQWVRTLAIKSIRDGRTLDLELMDAPKFAAWLETAGAGSFKNMHLVRDAIAAELADEHERAVYRMLGWLAVPENPNAVDLDNERRLEADIATQTTDGPESLADETDRIAVWLLDYAEMLDDETRLDKVAELLGSTSGQRRIEALKKAIANHGLLAVYGLGMRIRNDYLESVGKLDHSISPGEQSRSYIFEALADILTNQASLLNDSRSTGILQTVLADKLVGQSVTRVVREEEGKKIYEKALIKLHRQPAPSGDVNSSGQPTFKVKEELDFNPHYFDAKDNPAISKGQVKAWQQRETFRKPARDIARDIYQKLNHGVEPADSDYAQLGRLLRRLIAA